MIKSFLVSLVLISTVAANAAATKAEELNSILGQVLSQNNAKVSSEIRAELLDKLSLMNQLEDEDRRTEIAKTRIQKFASCTLADAVIIANGVGEALPVAAVGMRELDSRFVGVEIDPDTTAALQSDRISWNNLLGAGLDSIVGVSIETLSSWDLKKIESKIQKSFPGTQIMAVKMKGEASFCGQSTLKLDLLKALEARAAATK